jgi:pilus assembly protein Flp/PilA
MTKLYLELMNRINDREEGQGMVEYGLIVVLVSIVCAGILLTLGTTLEGVFTNIDSKLTPSA